MAMPAAPSTGDDHRDGVGELLSPTILRAFCRPARATTAVPCWSSWKTGISSRSLSTVLDLKRPGGGDVFEVDAAERGSQADHGLDQFLRGVDVEADGEGVDVDQTL